MHSPLVAWAEYFTLLAFQNNHFAPCGSGHFALFTSIALKNPPKLAEISPHGHISRISVNEYASHNQGKIQYCPRSSSSSSPKK